MNNSERTGPRQVLWQHSPAGDGGCQKPVPRYYDIVRIDRMGEAAVIRLIEQSITRRGRLCLGIGDDACLLENGTALTTDAYAEGVHFDLSYLSYRDVGRRCTCAALSDIVAMAAEPEALLVALCVPRTTTDRELHQLYRGIDDVCRRLGCEVAGGDIISFERLVLVLTAAGRTNSPRLRSMARPGDKVYVTGHCGLAETGRLLLAAGAERRGLTAERAATTRHRFPLPRVAVMRALHRHIRALIDTSDGIATDCRHLAERSRVAITIDASAIPIAGATRRLCARRGLDIVSFALTSGEDHELLFTTPRSLPPRVCRTKVTAIGRVVRGRGLFLGDNTRARPLEIGGYDHLTPH